MPAPPPLRSASYEPIINTLLKYLEKHPELHSDLNEAFLEAKGLGIKEFDNIKTLNDYIEFYNANLHWVPAENTTATALMNRLCMFYFVLDLLPPVYQTAINPDGGWTWLSQWLVDYAQVLGKWLDDPKSINKESIQTFYDCKQTPPKGYHMEDYPRPPGDWKTFNEFFARNIYPKARPICEPENSKLIASPADCTFLGHYSISDKDTTKFVKVKGVPWSISELLQDTECGERFKGGKFMHAFLGPYDYHRQHAPVSGKVVVAKVIPGICYLEVIIKDDKDGHRKLEMHRNLHRPHPTLRYPGATAPASDPKDKEITAPDTPGYQFLQARGLVVIDNEEIGLVAVMPIGMAQISSVVLSPDIQVGKILKKGDEIAYFQYGGSDVVMVFEEKAKVDFSKTKRDQWYKFGEELATANP